MANVLIVDDDRDLAQALAEVLVFEGHETTIARHGREGLARIYERKPDLILLDVEMPVLDGPAMARRLLAFEAAGDATPIILVSGIPRLAALAASMGTPFFLRKPFTTETLLQMVANALGRPSGTVES